MSSVDHKVSDSAFVGRVTELDALRRAAGSAREGCPAVVWIEGPAGYGKTTLLRRGLDDDATSFEFSRVGAEEMASTVSYDLTRRLGARRNDDGFAVGQELLALWAQLQESGPVAVVVEDAHWADADSLQALLSAARRLENDRVALLLTSRCAPTEAWERFLRDDERCQSVVLQPFGNEEVAALASLYGRELTTHDAARLRDHTAGHPLWVHRLLVELSPEELKAPDGLPAPRSLASAVVASLAAVAPSGQDLAAALAVVNQREPVAVIGRVAGLERPLEALDALLPTAFVRWDPRVPGSPMEFTHPLYRQAIYDDLAPLRRRDLHAAAARVLTPPVVLAHRVAAVDGADEALANELEEGAASEMAAGEPALAARNLLWASSISEDASRSGRLVVDAGLAFIDAHQQHRAVELVDAVARAPRSPSRDLLLGWIAWETGDATAAEELLGAAARGPAAPSDIAARAWSKLAEITITRGRVAEGLDAADAALALADANTPAERNGWTMRAAGVGLLRGAAEGLDVLAQRLPAEPSEIPAHEVEMLVIRGMLQYYAGRPSAALNDLRAALCLAEDGAVLFQIARCHFFIASSLIRQGDLNSAMVHARTATSLAREESMVWDEPQCRAALGMLLAFRGDLEGAEREVSAAFDRSAALDSLEGVATATLAASTLARVRHDPDAVVRALEGLTASPPMLAQLQFWPWFVEALLEIGQLERAKAEIERLEDAAIARRLDLRWQIVVLRAGLAAANGRSLEAVDLYAEALEHLGPDDSHVDRALAHRSYGQLLCSLGDRRGGVEHLQRARQMLASVGAAPFVARLDQDLVAVGRNAEPPPEQARPALGLTDRERDVATLVAKGMSNPEVAAQLYVSRKAVEYHLHNIYGKLGIRSRRELRGRAVFA